MKQIDKRILQAGIAHIEMFVVGIVALGLVGVLGFVGYNAWQNSNGEKQADAGTSGFVSSPRFCNSLGRELDTKPDAKKIVSNKWKIDNGWGLCKKACKHGDHKLVSGNPYDKCVRKTTVKAQDHRDTERILAKKKLDAKKKACKSTSTHRKTWQNNKCESKKKIVNKVCKNKKAKDYVSNSMCYRVKYRMVVSSDKAVCPSGYKSTGKYSGTCELR